MSTICPAESVIAARPGFPVPLGRGWMAAIRFPLAAISLLLAATILPLATPELVRAQAEDPVESARDVLRKSSRYPWYDAENDSIRRIDVKNSNTPNADNRDSTWQNQRSTANPPNFNWLGSGFWTFMQGLAWTLLALLLAGLIALLVWAFVRGEGRLPADGEGGLSVRRASDIDRVESLPFPVRRPDSDLLAEARKHYEQGNYGEAIIYLFSYQLVQLDKHQLIHLSKGKTNRQYLREIRRRPSLSRLLETTMIAFEDVFFGHHDLERRRFEDCWQGLDEFHQQMEQAQAAT